MTILTNRAGRGVLCALVASTAMLVTTTSFSAPRFDGTWSVLVMTHKGTCDPAYRYPIKITNGQLVNAGDAVFKITGKVAESGAITVTVSAGSQSATGTGKLAGASGGGSWSGGECSGAWTAERRGA